MRIFVSAPISGFQDENKYNEYRKHLLKLISKLRDSYDVYSEVEKVKELTEYDEPGKSAIDDFNRIEQSDLFLLHHPVRMQTSSLIELGYAVAKNKKIVIVSSTINLPYLALGLSSILKNIIQVENSDIDSIISAINLMSY